MNTVAMKKGSPEALIRDTTHPPTPSVEVFVNRDALWAASKVLLVLVVSLQLTATTGIMHA